VDGIERALLSADIFNLYVTLELLGFAAVTLVALAGQREALTAAMRYLFVSLSASCFTCWAWRWCMANAHGGSAFPGGEGAARPHALGGAGVDDGRIDRQSRAVPLHFWLPPAHANAPAPVSALLSALVVKGPFYILLRLWFEAFPALMTPAVAQAFGALGARQFSGVRSTRCSNRA